MANVGTRYDKVFVSSINFLDKRDIWDKALNITNEEDAFLNIMELMGRSVVTTNPVYRTFRNEELFEIITASGAPVQGSGANIQTVGLSAADVAKVRVNDLVLLESKKVAFVYSKNTGGPSIVLHSVDGTDISADCADTKKMVPFSNAYGEGTAGPTEHRKFGATSDYNIVQIFQETYSMTDVELSNQIEFTVKGKPYYFLKEQHEHMVRFRAELALALLFGRQSGINFSDASPGLADADGNAVQTTKGLNQYIEDSGISLGSAQTLALATYASLVRAFKASRTPKEFMVLHGVEHKIAHDNVFSNLSSANVFSDQARLQVNGKTLDLGLTSMNIHGFRFLYKDLDVFDHKNIINFTGSAGYHKRALFIPQGKIKSVAGGEPQERIMCRYMQAVNGYFDNRYLERHTGGLVPKQMGGPTDDTDVWNITYRSAQGLHVNGAEHFALLDIN